jgi:hypothetical protein
LYSPGRVSRGCREEGEAGSRGLIFTWKSKQREQGGGRRNDGGGGDDKGEGIERDNDKALPLKRESHPSRAMRDEAGSRGLVFTFLQLGRKEGEGGEDKARREEERKKIGERYQV